MVLKGKGVKVNKKVDPQRDLQKEYNASSLESSGPSARDRRLILPEICPKGEGKEKDLFACGAVSTLLVYFCECPPVTGHQVRHHAVG